MRLSFILLPAECVGRFARDNQQASNDGLQRTGSFLPLFRSIRPFGSFVSFVLREAESESDTERARASDRQRKIQTYRETSLIAGCSVRLAGLRRQRKGVRGRDRER